MEVWGVGGHEAQARAVAAQEVARQHADELIQQARKVPCDSTTITNWLSVASL